MNFKKIGLLVALGLGLIAVVFFGVQRLTKGTLTVTTGSKTSSIRIVQAMTDAANEVASSKVINESKGSVSVTVPSGTYFVAVENGDQATSKTVTVENGKTTSINLSTVQTIPVEPVADTNAKSIIAGKTHAYYLDPTTQNLFSITGDNKIQSVNPAIQFSSIQWVDSTYGVGQGINGSLYSISNGAIARLDTRIPVSFISETNFAVAPSRQLYVTFNNAVYRSNPGTAPQKIASTTSSAHLVASVDGVTVITSGGSGAKAKTDAATITFIDLKGGSVKKEMGVYELAWSPDGKQVATSDDVASTLYDRNFKKLASLPAANTSSLVWLDNNTLLYAVSSQLWRYDTATRLAERIANMPDQGALSGISPSDQKDYVYVAAEHGYNKPVIKRVGLQGQKFDDVVNQLQAVMPIITNDYLMTLVNFSQPTVFVQPTAYTELGTYTQAATADLKARGINIAAVKLVFGQTN